MACIKRWPITSLHPFGTLVEQLGEMGNLKVETDALLRDNNFGPDDFSEGVLRSIEDVEKWSLEQEDEAVVAARRDFRDEDTFTIDPNGADELDDAVHVKHEAADRVEIGVHIADVTHFVKPNSVVDREARKRATGVQLTNRTVKLLPPQLSAHVLSLSPDQDKFTVSVVYKVNPETGRVYDGETWIGKSIIRSSRKLSYKEVDAVIRGHEGAPVDTEMAQRVQTLQVGHPPSPLRKEGHRDTSNRPDRRRKSPASSAPSAWAPPFRTRHRRSRCGICSTTRTSPSSTTSSIRAQRASSSRS